jgi:N-methylhydantoinase B
LCTVRADLVDQSRIALLGAFELNEGDVIRIHTANGGGYGDPRRRPRELVLADLREGYVTEGSTRRVRPHLELVSE